MMRRTAGLLISACALGASAFLLPPGILPTSDADNVAIPNWSPPDSKSQNIVLPCPSCVRPSNDESPDPLEDGDDLVWAQGVTSSLVLDFTISEDGERLLLNTQTFYPLPEYEPSLPIYALQIASSPSVDESRAQQFMPTMLEITGAGVILEEETVSADGDLVIPVTLGIFQLERQPATVDDVQIRMLKTAEGELSILDVTIVTVDPSSRLPSPPVEDFASPFPPDSLDEFVLEDDSAPLPPSLPTPDSESEDCNAFCKLRKAIASRLERIKHGKLAKCKGRKHSFRPGSDDEPRRRHGNHHHMHPHDGEHGHRHEHGSAHSHGHHRHHHRHHHVLHSFVRGVAAILVPTLAGVAVGMAVSVLGLVVGRLISFVWIRWVRGGRRGYASVATDDTDARKEEFAVVEDVEALPVYEEAPAYEEVSSEQK